MQQPHLILDSSSKRLAQLPRIWTLILSISHPCHVLLAPAMENTEMPNILISGQGKIKHAATLGPRDA